MRKMVHMPSTNNSDVLVFVDKIQCVIEKGNGCCVYLDNGHNIEATGISFADVKDALEKVL